MQPYGRCISTYILQPPAINFLSRCTHFFPWRIKGRRTDGLTIVTCRESTKIVHRRGQVPAQCPRRWSMGNFCCSFRLLLRRAVSCSCGIRQTLIWRHGPRTYLRKKHALGCVNSAVLKITQPWTCSFAKAALQYECAHSTFLDGPILPYHRIEPIFESGLPGEINAAASSVPCGILFVLFRRRRFSRRRRRILRLLL